MYQIACGGKLFAVTIDAPNHMWSKIVGIADEPNRMWRKIICCYNRCTKSYVEQNCWNSRCNKLLCGAKFSDVSTDLPNLIEQNYIGVSPGSKGGIDAQGSKLIGRHGVKTLLSLCNF
ncbi:hypothetical protein AVEN_20053-1 [Araneus ventricosus]|uniref:Uncharacterized protein n=1 Tax=Araneus ventricosus TaxID=182803 RepID=A0A4Y2QC93_ARAVE|nr:hypothetical protein AVEN_20053-1 [Araneus ventricosus]